MEKKSLFEPAVYNNCLARINKLNADVKPQWGKMNAAQMLAHCAEVQEVTNGKPLEKTPFLIKLAKGLIKKFVVNDKPYPKGTKTHPQYIKDSSHNFAVEHTRLLAALKEFVDNEEKTEAIRHSLFGTMTKEEKGWAMYKHLDHHLTQFGV